MSQLYAQPNARNEQVNVIATSGKILDATFSGQPRRQMILRNTSPNAIDIITIALGQNKAVVNQGIVLRQNDVYMESAVNNPTLDVWQGSVQGICATANGKLSIMEV
jgi:hypothetical protein